MLRFKMITFDATGTLIRIRQSVGHHYAKFARKYGAHGDEEALNENFRAAFGNQRKVHPNFGTKTGIAVKDWWGGVTKETFRLAGSPMDEDILAKMNDEMYEYSKTSQMWEVYPEVKEMLTYLNRNGVCLGVLSDNDDRLSEIFRNLSIAGHFSFLLPSVYAANEKPDSSLFKLALERLRLPASDVAHIGDNYKRDFEGARGVGMHPILIDRNGTLQHDHPDLVNDHLITDLTDLEGIIRLGNSPDPP